MPIIGNDDLVCIDLPAEGEQVWVKRCLSRGDAIKVQQAITQGARISAGGVNDGGLDLSVGTAIEAAEFATLDVAIKKWSFPEPVTPENIRALDEASVDAIKARMNELYPAARTDDERGNSSANGAAPRRVRARSLKN